MGNGDAQCKRCLYWEREEEENTLAGWCLRFPPTVLLSPTQAEPWEEGEQDCLTVWPKTFQDDWCGEFHPRPQSQPP